MQLQLTDTFIDLVRQCAAIDATATESALEQLQLAVDKLLPVSLAAALPMLFNQIVSCGLA